MGWNSAFAVGSRPFSMKSNLLSPDLTVHGRIKDIIYRDEENHFNVLTVESIEVKPFLEEGATEGTSNGDLGQPIVVRGQGSTLATLNPGDAISVSGRWEEHKKHGKQFVVVCKAPDINKLSVGVLEAYLSGGAIRGVGPSTAKKITGGLGDDTQLLFGDNPSALFDRLVGIPGLGKKTVGTILDGMTTNLKQRKILLALLSQGFTISQARMLYQRYGSRALGIMTGNPYLLVEEVQGFGFATADEIALREGIAVNSEFRVESGILHTLTVAGADGHCCLPHDELAQKSLGILAVGNMKKKDKELLKMEEDGVVDVTLVGVEKAISGMIANAKLCTIDIGDYLGEPEAEKGPLSNKLVYHPKVYAIEKDLATNVVSSAKVLGTNPPKDGVPTCTPVGDETVLSNDQLKAVAMARGRHKLSVLTGGPGTGKTFVMKEIVKTWESMGLKIVLASPTARAAQRLGAAAGGDYSDKAKTVHRLLEYNPRTNTFSKSKHNLLEVDAVVVDEASMLDIYLASSLLNAIPAHARILLVGDANQLPSVGAGNVLRDIIKSSVVPVVELRTIFRQDQASAIVKDAHLINETQYPRSMKRLQLNAASGKVYVEDVEVEDIKSTKGGGNVLFFQTENPADAIEIISGPMLNFIKSLGFDVGNDVQFLSPMVRGQCGTTSICNRVQISVNENADSKNPGLLSVGDRVMQDANDYNLGVWNGEIGKVVERYYSKGGRAYVVEFDGGRRVRYEGAASKRLRLAYACTIHKSQGSEFPVVVMPVLNEHFHMLSKNLLYTGLTRAERLAIFIGSPRMLQIAIKKVNASQRNTGLWFLIQEMSDGSFVEDSVGEQTDRFHRSNLWDDLGLEEVVKFQS